MNPVLLKGLLGTGVLSSSVGTIAVVQQYLSLSGVTSKYDVALLEFLAKGGDIQFEITKQNGNQDKTITSKDQLQFTDNSSTLTFSAHVTTSVEEWFKTEDKEEAKEQYEVIKKLADDNKHWTWTCSFTLDRGSSTATEIDETYRDRILSEGNKGLLGILQKDLSKYPDGKSSGKTEWTKEDLKAVKSLFISTCAARRSTIQNRNPINEGINEDLNKIFLHAPVIKIKMEANAQNKLVPTQASAALFGIYFQEKYATNTYQASTVSSEDELEDIDSIEV